MKSRTYLAINLSHYIDKSFLQDFNLVDNYDFIPRKFVSLYDFLVPSLNSLPLSFLYIVDDISSVNTRDEWFQNRKDRKDVITDGKNYIYIQ